MSMSVRMVHTVVMAMPSVQTPRATTLVPVEKVSEEMVSSAQVRT